jgi:N-methylhydantoinase B
MNLDPVTTELIREQLVSTAREMSERLKRAAYSPMIRETLDFCSALHAPTGEVIAQATGIPGLFGLMSQSVVATLERIGLAAMEPGDVVICNDPYEAGGMHLNDVNIIRPIFAEDEPIMIAQCKAHWVDIGSVEPGGWTPDATDMYQEGLRLPPVRLMRRGHLNEGLLDLICANVRLPTEIRGDLLAQVGATAAGVARIGEVLERHGREALTAAMRTILDQAEQAVRARIRAVPDGTVRVREHAEPEAGATEAPQVDLALTISGDEVIADFTGSSKQGLTSFGNCSLPATEGLTRLAIKSVLDPLGPTNEGSYRPVHVVAPSGSCVNPSPPSPVTVGPANVGHAVLLAVQRALAPLLPDRAVADEFGSVQVLVLSGRTPGSAEPFILFTSGWGGGGARAGRDGLHGVATQVDGDVRNMPVEVIETTLPVRVERFELRDDSGGPGRQRGGVGVRADYRLLAPCAEGSIALNRVNTPPGGVFGGASPLTSRLVINPDTPGERILTRGAFTLAHGDVCSHQIGGGGGYGPAETREPQAVVADVLAGYVSTAAAERDYAVIVDDDGHLDTAATRRRREADRREPVGAGP